MGPLTVQCIVGTVQCSCEFFTEAVSRAFLAALVWQPECYLYSVEYCVTKIRLPYDLQSTLSVPGLGVFSFQSTIVADKIWNNHLGVYKVLRTAPQSPPPLWLKSVPRSKCMQNRLKNLEPIMVHQKLEGRASCNRWIILNFKITHTSIKTSQL